ncbi:flagellin [Dyella sp. RRB7]|uniref:flagellin N-terminal helical domain-containing protein n=1 Tax=Dyella sp. RRB7 TaxID=2919502 RepID=UPI001FA9843F|nr:flagellin [Dyella sp. RRB7]
MSLVINTNISSLQTQNNLSKSQSALAQATERLSSGLKINSAADNAAGFAISQQYTTQIGGLTQASANASDAINLAQTAGSALDQVTSNLQAIRDLAVQSANGTYTSADRASIDQEVQQRLQEITRIANQTTFNGSNILDGSLGTKSFQIGANVGQTISVSLNTDVKASQIGQVAEVNTGSISGAFAGLSVSTGSGSGTGALTVTTGGTGGTAVNVAVGTYHSVSGLAAAINNAAGTGVATVNSSGQLVLASGTTLGGGDATALGTVGSGGLVSGAQAAVGDLSAETLTINGKAVKLTGVTSLQDLSDTINAAGVSGVTAAVNAAGNGVNFYSSNALTISDSTSGVITSGATDGNTGVNFTAGSANASTGGSLANGNVLTVDSANDLISRIDVALTTVSNFSAQLGAVQNRFQSTISTVQAQTTNLQSSQSTIQDADFASETASLSQAQVLQQAGISVLAQANSNPQQVLKLLQ